VCVTETLERGVSAERSLPACMRERRAVECDAGSFARMSSFSDAMGVLAGGVVMVTGRSGREDEAKRIIMGGIISSITMVFNDRWIYFDTSNGGSA
jgi:hypothetical protein